MRFAQRIEKKLSANGWLIADFPQKYGGGKIGPIEQGLVYREMGYNLVMPWPNYIGHSAARTMLRISSQGQIEKWVPAIARGGETIWAEGYSEPEAGSDLANVKTTAVRDGDSWVINGQKSWTSQAAYADVIWILARSSPNVRKQAGLSIFIAEMKTPGIRIQRQRLLGRTIANDTFFDNVRVPKENLVGEEGMGWAYFAMGNQPAADTRAGGQAKAIGRANPLQISHQAVAQRRFDELLDYCKTARWNGKPVASDPVARNMLAELRVLLECWRVMAWRLYWTQVNGLPTGPLAPLPGLYMEFYPKFYKVGREILRNYALIQDGSRLAPIHGLFEDMATHQWHGLHPAGGVNIRRNLIATRGLGLPR